MKPSTECRREFLRNTLAGGLAAVAAGRLAQPVFAAPPRMPVAPAAGPATSAAPVKVALTNGDQRADNVFRALRSIEKEIAQANGNRRPVIKINNVSTTNQLAATHADAVQGILDFLKSIGKIDNAIVAESSMGNTAQGFQNFGYAKVTDKYGVKLVDLDQQPFRTVLAINETDAIPHPVRVSSILANQQDNFIISACMLKTHNLAVATMSLKNVVVGSALKLPGGNAGRGGGGGGRGGRGGGFGGSDKPILHGGGARGININLAMLAPLLHPSLAVIDGFQGMEGNGPIMGTPVDHRVCVVSTDWVAADTVGARLMGIDPGDIGYLTYCANGRMGESDTSRMEILGEPIDKLARIYQQNPSMPAETQWKMPSRITGT